MATGEIEPFTYQDYYHRYGAGGGYSGGGPMFPRTGFEEPPDSEFWMPCPQCGENVLLEEKGTTETHNFLMKCRCGHRQVVQLPRRKG